MLKGIISFLTSLCVILLIIILLTKTHQNSNEDVKSAKLNGIAGKCHSIQDQDSNYKQSTTLKKYTQNLIKILNGPEESLEQLNRLLQEHSNVKIICLIDLDDNGVRTLMTEVIINTLKLEMGHIQTIRKRFHNNNINEILTYKLLRKCLNNVIIIDGLTHENINIVDYINSNLVPFWKNEQYSVIVVLKFHSDDERLPDETEKLFSNLQVSANIFLKSKDQKLDIIIKKYKF